MKAATVLEKIDLDGDDEIGSGEHGEIDQE
jgi:hypothetical protein